MAQLSAVLASIFVFTFEFHKIHAVKPVQINPNEIIFELHVTNTTKDTKAIKHDLESINIAKPTIIVIHGWQANRYTAWLQNMTNVLLCKKMCNVITVDWSAYSNSLNYPIVRAQAKQVGEAVGEFLMNITQNATENLQNLHIIGHSLGAQVAGFAGQKIYSKLKKKVARITELEAAGPLFESAISSQRLSEHDAEHADAIHTNGGVFGFFKSYGTADYFVNGGGRIQPGCYDDLCSHSPAHELYIESISSDKFVTVPCPLYIMYEQGACNFNNKTIMGDNEPDANSGTYFHKCRIATRQRIISAMIFGLLNSTN